MPVVGAQCLFVSKHKCVNLSPAATVLTVTNIIIPTLIAMAPAMVILLLIRTNFPNQQRQEYALCLNPFFINILFGGLN